MKNRLYAVSFLLLGLGGGLVIKETLTHNAYIGCWILGAGGLLLILLLISEPIRKGFNKIWGGRSNEWWATSSYENGSIKMEADPQRALSKNKRERWRSPRPQESEARFEVDMAKERMIASIDIEPDDDWIEKPTKWRMMFYGSGHKTLCHKDGKGFISVKSNDIPNRIQYFQIQIKESAEDMRGDSNYAKRYGVKVYWTISLIKLREYKLKIFGKRFWTHAI